MPSFTRLLSRSGETKEKEKEKEKEAHKRASVSVDEGPPTYTATLDGEDHEAGPRDITAGFANIKLGYTAKPIPEPQECIAHLKLLECFHRIREIVGSTEGLFGISDSVIEASFGNAVAVEEVNKTRAVIADKRWQVYVSRAVLRFEHWRKAVEPQYQYLRLNDISTSRLSDAVRARSLKSDTFKARSQSTPIVDENSLPPIGKSLLVR